MTVPNASHDAQLQPSPALIHPTALIDPRAELDSSVSVGAYSVIGPDVQIAAGTHIGPHCVIEGPTRLGRDNRVFQFASLGAAPQDMKYRGEPTALHIGDRNTIREFCTFNRGTAQDGGVTRVGDDNWIMAYVHLAHDVQVGSHTILANNATLAGHVHIGDWVIVGGLTGVHQFTHIGAHAMTGFQSHVSQDVPPYMLVSGNPLSVHGFNIEGLRRRGFSRARIARIKQMHRLLYRDGLSLDQAKAAIVALLDAPLPGAVDADGAGAPGATGAPVNPGSTSDAAEALAAQADVQRLLDFLQASTRGMAR